MVNINLMNWRGELHKYQHRVLRYLLSLSLGSALLILAALHFYIVSSQQQLALEDAALQQKLNQPAAQAILRLQSENADIKHSANFVNVPIAKIFVKISHAVGGASCFSEITRAKNTINFSGTTRSALDLQRLVRAFPSSLLKGVAIESIQVVNNAYQFRLNANLREQQVTHAL